MKILLDTHYLLWALEGSHLSDEVVELLLDPGNEVFYSVISLWEVGIKHHIHPEHMPCSSNDIYRYAKDAGYEIIRLKEDHIFAVDGIRVKDGEKEHGDPFDRILLAQAKYENLRLLTTDGKMKVYDEANLLIV